MYQVNDSYENFEFYRAYQKIYDFCNIELSTFYLDMVKGRLYTYAADSCQRRAAQTVIYEILNVLVRIMAPILVFTAEEIWQNMPREKKYTSIFSVHLLDWPQKDRDFAQGDLTLSRKDKNIDDELKAVIELIPSISKMLEDKRSIGLIGSSFDAKINLLTNNEIRYKYLKNLENDLCEIFKVSQVNILRQDNLDSAKVGSEKLIASSDIVIEISKADGLKCVRCWNYSCQVGKHKEHPLLCDNCLEAIGGK